MIKTRRIKILLVSIIIGCACIMSGCDNIKIIPGTTSSINTQSTESEEESALYPVIINDTEITKEIDSIISLTPAYTEILCEFGLASKLKAVSSYCDYPAETIKDLPKVSGSTNPDIDKIIEIKPDIVITATPIITKDKIKLESSGISVLTIPSPQSLAQLKQTYEFIGLAFFGLIDGKDKGDSIYHSVETAIQNTIQDNKTSFVYITASLTPAGGNTLESDVLSLFGDNIAKESNDYTFDKNDLTVNQPDQIFLSDAFTIDDLLKDDVYSTLDAVKNEKVIIIQNSYFERPTSRITEIINLLHNEFKNSDSSISTSSISDSSYIVSSDVDTESIIESSIISSD